MRKSLAAAALIAAALLAGPGAYAGSSSVATEGESEDVIVLLDVSQSVLPYFQEVTDYVVGSVVRDFLRLGDTFHLLTFGDEVQVEIAQRLSDERDVKSVLGKLYLLYPLARSTDLVSAFGYLYQYVADLPLSRGKVVVIITDGVHNPAAGGASAGLSPEAVRSELDAVAAKIRRDGWPVYIIKIPFSAERAGAETAAVQSGAKASAPGAAGGVPASPSGAAGSGSSGAAAGSAAASGAAGAAAQAPGSQAQPTDYVGDLGRSLGATVTEYSSEGKEDLAKRSLSLPEIEFPGPLGKRGYAFSFPLKVTNRSDSDLGLELERVSSGSSELLEKKSFLSLGPGKSGVMKVSVRLPEGTEPGPLRLPVELFFADGLRAAPSRGVLELTLAPSFLSALFRSGARALLFALLLAIGLGAALFAVILVRRAPRRAAAPIVAAVRESSEREAGPAATARGGQAARPQAPGLPLKAASGAAPAAPSKPAQAPVRAATSPVAEVPAPAAELRPQPSRAAKVPARREKAPVPSGYQPRVARPGTIQVELRVEDQNPHI
ncbi:MAG TPA: VWA domain-containing protein, partial [Spirochaetales bacterium]|nr:VWA domain-containing protein [Spirochaetales bacterium]